MWGNIGNHISTISKISKISKMSKKESPFTKQPASAKERIIFNSMNNMLDELNEHDETGQQQILQDQHVHIRTQQRNGRKCITLIQNMPAEYDLKKLVKALRKMYACNGAVVEHNIYGEVVILQGDKRMSIHEFLTKVGLVKAENIKFH